MEMKLEKDVTNKLLNRREMVLDVTYKGSTPSREEIRDEATRKLGLKHGNIVIVSIDQIYGAGGAGCSSTSTRARRRRASRRSTCSRGPTRRASSRPRRRRRSRRPRRRGLR